MPYCNVGWSSDGRLFTIGVSLDLATGVPSRTLAIPLPRPWAIPDLQPSGIHAIFNYASLAERPGVLTLAHGGAVVGLSPATYVFTNADFHTNLFRIPLKR
jgi:hypothetical protein